MINCKGNYYTSSKTHPVHLVFPIACFPTFYSVDRCWKAIKINAILVTRQIDGFVSKAHMLLCIHNSNNTGVYDSADDHHLILIVSNKAFSSYQKLGLGICRNIRKLYLLVARKDDESITESTCILCLLAFFSQATHDVIVHTQRATTWMYHQTLVDTIWWFILYLLKPISLFC